MKKYIVLGAGIAGISAGYHAKLKNIDCKIFEANSYVGGLCSNFTIDGFRFDNAVHLSFTNDKYVRSIFDQTDYYKHIPDSYNYSNGYWLKHPLQNNLYHLPIKEKIEIIKGFVKRNTNMKIGNYEDWLISQYGDYFAMNYPIKYTKKYWTVDADKLSTEWLGNRMYRPSLDEVLQGAMSDETPNTYYAKEMRYPKHGGYSSFLNPMLDKCHISLCKKAIRINADKKYVEFQDSSKYYYDNLISTIPLPNLIKMLDNVPINIKLIAEELVATSIALVSIGFHSPDIAKYLWFYIYDENIQTSRVYSPSLKSIDNVSENCKSSLQFEIYYSKYRPLAMQKDNLIEHVVKSLEKMNIATKEDISMIDCRMISYGNVVYMNNMVVKRNIIKEYLKSININVAGRFGEWDYLWSDQSLLSGKNAVDNMN